MKFPKQAKTFPEQIALLKKRGLKIENEQEALRQLYNISYYRLSAYFIPFQRYNDPTHTFMPWATFRKIMDTYRLDRELRIMTIDAIERIEVAFRCRLVYEYCHVHGNNWYEEPTLYAQGFHGTKGTYTNIISELQRTKETFIEHYKKTYTNPVNPPAWMVLEVLSFGQLSKLYKNLKLNNEKKLVADYFGVDVPILVSWMEHLAYIRNLCAHHSRFWNRILTVKAKIPSHTKNQWVTIPPPAKNNKAYLSICIMEYMLHVVDPKSYFFGKLQTLINRLPKVDLKAAGFPPDWRKDIFWRGAYVAITYKFRAIYFRCRNMNFK